MSTYDEVPYPSLSYVQTHPDTIATQARLLGLEVAPADHCRVLEIGCAGGGNLMPMAYTLPHSEFVGIDFSPRQIAAGKALYDPLGLPNLTLLCLDIRDVPADFGTFDYIIAHGIYSWVPEPVRDSLLQLCQRHLAPNGIAYISYNTYPGWHLLGILRDAMLYHTRKITEPQRRITEAQAMLSFMAEHVLDPESIYGAFCQSYVSHLEQEIGSFGPLGNSFLLHDQLEEVNQPVYFYQFMEHAARYGLQYLMETEAGGSLPEHFRPETQHALEHMAHSLIEMEQYMDFLRDRTFRRTLLCRAELPLNRVIKPERVQEFYITSRAAPVSETPDILSTSVEKFRGPGEAVLATDHPVSKAAMLHLAQIWPRATSFAELMAVARAQVGRPTDPAADPAGWADDAHALGFNLLKAHVYSTNLVELHTYAPALTLQVSERPVASLAARIQAQQSEITTNLWHERIQLEAVDRQLLQLLDGTHDRARLVDDLVALVAQGVLTIRQHEAVVQEPTQVRGLLVEKLEESLRKFAQMALLIA